MLALLDLDVVLYRCGFASEKRIYKAYVKGDEKFGHISSFESKKEADTWINGSSDFYLVKEIEPEPLANCLHSVKIQIKSILDAVSATSYEGFLTGKDQFRENIATIKPYKGNRDPLQKPFYYNEIKDYLINKWNAKVIDYYEGDDALAMAQMLHYKPAIENEYPEESNLSSCDSIICSIDKDLDQIPGWHYNFVKKQIYWVTEEDATKWFYIQLIAGDIVDNIQGIPGMGIKTASKVLRDCVTENDMYKVARDLYKKTYKEKYKEILEETAQLVYMVKEKGVRWAPPKK